MDDVKKARFNVECRVSVAGHGLSAALDALVLAAKREALIEAAEAWVPDPGPDDGVEAWLRGLADSLEETGR